MSNVNIGFFAEEIPEKLYFLGKEIKFPEVYFRYAAVKSEFLPEVRRTIEQMESSFDDKIGYFDDFVKYGNLLAAKDHGRVRQEGRDYVVQDGDIIVFKFNV